MPVQAGKRHASTERLMRSLIMSRTLDLPKAMPESSRSARALWRAVGRRLVRVVCNQVNAWTMRRAIQSLQALDDRTLADIGLHRSEIEYAVLQQMTRHAAPIVAAANARIHDRRLRVSQRRTIPIRRASPTEPGNTSSLQRKRGHSADMNLF